MRGRRGAGENAREGLGKQIVEGSREKAEENGTLLLAKNGCGSCWLERESNHPSLTFLSLLVLCHPDCTPWYLEIPVFQIKTFV